MMISGRLKMTILTILTVGILAPLFAFLLHKSEVVDVLGVERAANLASNVFEEGFEIPFFNKQALESSENRNVITEVNTQQNDKNKHTSLLTVSKNMLQTALHKSWGAVKAAGYAISTIIQTAINSVLSFVKDVALKIYNGTASIFLNISNGITATLSAVYEGLSSVLSSAYNAVASSFSYAYQGVGSLFTGAFNAIEGAISSVTNIATEIPKTIYSFINEGFRSFNSGVKNAVTGVGKTVSSVPSVVAGAFAKEDADLENFDPNIYEPAAGNEGKIVVAQKVSQADEPLDEKIDFKYDIEDEILNVEGVLVPQSSTVISSSRDGKIAKINFENGDMFQKGDILIEYVCEDFEAEMEAAKAKKSLTEKRMMRNEKLLKLDIISDIEHLGFKAEDIKASAQARIVEQRMEQCYIRAAYDGRVTNKLANEHEFTRTDRVLMEVASLDDLEVEFLVPSRWLRWVNVDAPIALQVNETDEAYDATIKRIYGEIDPVSQSIQMTAKLDEYSSPLLPGMSGTITIDVARIRDAGVYGFLEQPRYSSKSDTAP